MFVNVCMVLNLAGFLCLHLCVCFPMYVGIHSLLHSYTIQPFPSSSLLREGEHEQEG
jgi:hypothetical protein